MGAGLTAALVWWLFTGQREDVAIARAFLTHIAQEEHFEAHALMSPELAAQVPTATLAQQFGQIQPWDHIGFRQRSTQSFGDARATELHGHGTTASDCVSTLYIRLYAGQIVQYDVTPLCRVVGEDA